MATEDDEDFLDAEDYARIISDLLEQARGGLTEAEIYRRAALAADHVRNWKVSFGIYENFRAGRVRISLSEDETDVLIESRQR